MIFHEPIGLKDVRPDLASPRDVELTVFDGLRLGFLLFQLELEHSCTQDLHTDVLVFMLRSFVLTLDDDPGREMGNADRRIGRIHVLPAFASRSIGIDSQVFFVDYDFNLVVDLRIDRYGSE